MSGCVYQTTNCSRAQVLPQQMFCRQKIFVGDRRPVFECRQNRTQSSDSDPGVGDESAVVSQVAWDVSGQTPMNKRDVLIGYALPQWKPVQLRGNCSIEFGDRYL